LFAGLLENVFRETFSVDWQWYWDHVRWQHPAMCLDLLFANVDKTAEYVVL